jgi:hypothetical protein
MTARKPLVPPELRELLEVFAELAKLPPLPALQVGIHDAWRNAREDRAAVLRVRIRALADELRIADKYPSGAQDLAEYCTRVTASVRQELAKPLGYEPKSEPAGGRPDG